MKIQSTKCSEIPAHLANPFKINEYFLSVFSENNQSCLESIYYRTNTFNSNLKFNFKVIDLNTLNSINNIKSNVSDCDGISLQMLNLCLPMIEMYILHIINLCLKRGYFPAQWKKGIVLALPKKTNPTSVNKPRPTIILPLLYKVLEGAACFQIYEYLNPNNIIPLHQSGFQKRYSTVTALANLSFLIVSTKKGCYPSFTRF